MIKATEEKWYICKIKNSSHPYDVFFVPEKFVLQTGKNTRIYSGDYIQTKRIQIYPPKILSKEEWVRYFQTAIDRYCRHYDLGHEGSFHFYNMVTMNAEMKDQEIKKLLQKITVPKNTNLNSITISYDTFDTWTKENTVRTWYVYPLIFPLGSLNDSLKDVQKLYVDLNIKDMIVRALTSKLK